MSFSRGIHSSRPTFNRMFIFRIRFGIMSFEIILSFRQKPLIWIEINDISLLCNIRYYKKNKQIELMRLIVVRSILPDCDRRFGLKLFVERFFFLIRCDIEAIQSINQ